ncbi:MAG: hypothetical protein AAF541_24555 [Pseudomonadota bacterium]
MELTDGTSRPNSLRNSPNLKQLVAVFRVLPTPDTTNDRFDPLPRTCFGRYDEHTTTGGGHKPPTPYHDG